MKRGSPGGILILAIGAVFLSLGWTGRYVAVWEALRTGQSQPIAGNPSVTPGGTPAAPSNPGATTPAGDIGLAPRAGGDCAPQMLKMCMGSDVLCVDPKNEIKANSVGWERCSGSGKVPQRAGQVYDEADYAVTLIPTGTMAATYQPNERGMFNA